MSFWELRASIDGYVSAHSGEQKGGAAPTPEDHDYLCEKYAYLDT